MDRATVTLQRPENLSRSCELQWTDTLFRQRSIARGQRINREVISQPVLVVQKVVRNFFKISGELEKFVANWRERSTQEIISCVMVFIQTILP